MQLYIFDMDGTFIDSMDYWRNISVTYLQKYDIEVDQDLKDQITSMTIDQSLPFLIDHFDLEEDQDQIKAQMHQMLDHQYQNVFQIDPFARDYFLHLKENNKKIVLATATQRSLADVALKRFDLEGIFDKEVVSDEVEIQKDSPDYFKNIGDYFNIDSEDSLVFEDSLYAIKSARESGMKIVSITKQASPAHLDEIVSLSHISGPSLFDLKDQLLDEENFK